VQHDRFLWTLEPHIESDEQPNWSDHELVVDSARTLADMHRAGAEAIAELPDFDEEELGAFYWDAFRFARNISVRLYEHLRPRASRRKTAARLRSGWRTWIAIVHGSNGPPMKQAWSAASRIRTTGRQTFARPETASRRCWTGTSRARLPAL